MSGEKIITSPALPVAVPDGNFVNTVFKDAEKWMMKNAITVLRAFKKATCHERSSYSEVRICTSICPLSNRSEGTCPNYKSKLNLYSFDQRPRVYRLPNEQYTAFNIQVEVPYGNELRRLILNIESKFIVFSREFEDSILLALKEDISKYKLFCIGNPLKLKARNVDDILYGKEFIKFSHPAQVTGEKTALIFVSGGTTGTPKAVELSHKALSFSLLSFHNPYHNIYWKPKDLEQSVFMGMFPQFFHVSGSLATLSSGLFIGGKIVIFPKYSPDGYIDGIKKYKRTFMFPSGDINVRTSLPLDSSSSERL
ncbi:hypothetical protein Anas_09840 [Armadillidium nasatum]|uniref:AMP-dependent synthetase/ligase domain-containing protein n=1 Tax=Armadillidium nasatum TaxID=96803 RepID=A0A5N5TAX3_9CRUS|nr:hypothetical protein Anas_09840 [Armadillidium nasatum]